MNFLIFSISFFPSVSTPVATSTAYGWATLTASFTFSDVNPPDKIIGKVVKGEGVYLKTKLGSEKKIEVPRGKLIPRIC